MCPVVGILGVTLCRRALNVCRRVLPFAPPFWGPLHHRTRSYPSSLYIALPFSIWSRCFWVIWVIFWVIDRIHGIVHSLLQRCRPTRRCVPRLFRPTSTAPRYDCCMWQCRLSSSSHSAFFAQDTMPPWTRGPMIDRRQFPLPTSPLRWYGVDQPRLAEEGPTLFVKRDIPGFAAVIARRAGTSWVKSASSVEPTGLQHMCWPCYLQSWLRCFRSSTSGKSRRTPGSEIQLSSF
jgi:hypothetical protein